MQGQQGKYYAVSGGTWIEVPDDTTLEDVKELFCWGEEARKYWEEAIPTKSQSKATSGSANVQGFSFVESASTSLICKLYFLLDSRRRVW